MGDYGLNEVFEYTELNLDSSDATNAGNSGGTITKASWPLFYYTTRSEDVAAVKVLQAEIPFTYYPINAANNTFTFTEGATVSTVTLPPNNYTGATLASQLQTSLSALSVGFTVSYNANTLLFTFTHNTAAAWSIFFNGTNTPYSFMGFDPNVTYSGSGIGSVIVSPNAAAVAGPRYLYINSRKLGPFINFNLADGSPTGGDFPGLCRVPVNAAYGSTILYNDPDPQKYFDLFLGREFDSFDFYLTLGSDQSQVPLDLRGSAWSLKLAILSYRKPTEQIYRTPETKKRRVIQ